MQDYAYALEDAAASQEERETARISMGWLTALSATIDDPVDLEPLAFALPEHSLILREQALELTQRLAKAACAAHDASGEENAAARAAIWVGNLANRLGDLSMREDALAAAEEAVTLYRTLAEAQPDVFAVNFSVSLCTLTDLNRSGNDREAALTAISEAIKVLTPIFNSNPPALVGEMTTNLHRYLQLCEDLEREPDTNLIGIPIAILERLRQENSNDE